jgi:hypothetical protein
MESAKSSIYSRQYVTYTVNAHPPDENLNVDELITQCQATAMHATRVTAHASLDYLTPGALLFHRKTYLDIPLVADIMALTNKRAVAINSRRLKANSRHLSYDNRGGEQVCANYTIPQCSQSEGWAPLSGPSPCQRHINHPTVSTGDRSHQQSTA